MRRSLFGMVLHGVPKYVKLRYNMASSCFLLLLLTVKTAFSAKILGYSAFGSGSHYYIVNSPLQELASRGHEVMHVSA